MFTDTTLDHHRLDALAFTHLCSRAGTDALAVTTRPEEPASLMRDHQLSEQVGVLQQVTVCEEFLVDAGASILRQPRRIRARAPSPNDR